MPKIVSIVFNDGGKLYDFDAAGLELAAGDRVIVSTARGTDFGRVVRVTEVAEQPASQGHLKKVMRKATEADLAQVERNRRLQTEALEACSAMIAEVGLVMKPVSAETTFDGNKVMIAFCAEERVDFRQIVSRLSERLGRRVELRQVSARDEARLVGGYGQCGRRLCCTLYAGNQEPVSIRMAKDQNLPLNPSKISGSCGRLMCCLKYEHEVYVSFKKRAPKRGSFVMTPSGQGKVTELLAPLDSVSVDVGEGRVIVCRLSDLGADKEEA